MGTARLSTSQGQISFTKLALALLHLLPTCPVWARLRSWHELAPVTPAPACSCVTGLPPVRVRVAMA